MYLLIIILPLLSCLSLSFLGRFLGKHGSNLFSFFCTVLCTILSSLAFYEVGLVGCCYIIRVAPWINSDQLFVSWEFLFDSLTVTMLLIVTLISSFVHVYSIKYMEADPHSIRFMAFLGIFTFFMIILITSSNLIQMFIGWEGVGFASYLLINFWYTRLYANQSAIKALIMNKVGDFGLLISILLVFYTFRSIEYATIFSCVPLFQYENITLFNFTFQSLTIIGLFLFLGAIGKSAQLGLHTWLPDAMEGPTPVSALIHAATMVTAGVFLLIRFSPLLEYTPVTLFVLTIVGSLTTFFAATIGTFQNDIKKIIAYSTCSQLGYMVFICGLSHYQVSIFHLVNHAFFKALLFLTAGSIIHALADEQDIRRMGSLKQFLPLTYSLMVIASLALIGFPFLSGFYSKDLILELSYVSSYTNLNQTYGVFAWWLGTSSVFFTAFYSFRLIYLVFLNTTNTQRTHLYKIHEMSNLMATPLVLLGFGSVFIGYLVKDLFVGIGTDFWENAIFSFPKYNIFFEAELTSIWVRWLPFSFTILGFSFANLINKYSISFYNKIVWLVLFTLNKKWYIDYFYSKVIVKPILKFGYHISFKNLDKGFLEFIGPYGLTYVIKILAQNLIRIQTGQITHYIFFIIVGLLLAFLVQFSFFLSIDKCLAGIYFIYITIFLHYKN